MELTTDVRTEIQARLFDIERERGVEILLAVEAGSRAWGFHSSNSDYDVRFIYRRPLSYYMSIHERRDVIEPPVHPVWDLAGWDVKKALFQMHRGNPALFEWLQSPTVYWEWPDYLAKLRGLMVPYFNPRSAIYHYLHMASNNYRTYIEGKETPRLKKYLYVVRPLLACMYIEQNHTMPPVSFDALFGTVTWQLGEYIPVLIGELIYKKQSGEELGEGPAIPTLDGWIDKQLDHFNRAARTTAKHNKAADDLDEFFFNTVVR